MTLPPPIPISSLTPSIFPSTIQPAPSQQSPTKRKAPRLDDRPLRDLASNVPRGAHVGDTTVGKIRKEKDRIRRELGTGQTQRTGKKKSKNSRVEIRDEGEAENNEIHPRDNKISELLRKEIPLEIAVGAGEKVQKLRTAERKKDEYSKPLKSTTNPAGLPTPEATPEEEKNQMDGPSASARIEARRVLRREREAEREQQRQRVQERVQREAERERRRQEEAGKKRQQQLERERYEQLELELEREQQELDRIREQREHEAHQQAQREQRQRDEESIVIRGDTTGPSLLTPSSLPRNPAPSPPPPSPPLPVRRRMRVNPPSSKPSALSALLLSHVTRDFTASATATALPLPPPPKSRQTTQVQAAEKRVEEGAPPWTGRRTVSAQPERELEQEAEREDSPLRWRWERSEMSGTDPSPLEILQRLREQVGRGRMEEERQREDEARRRDEVRRGKQRAASPTPPPPPPPPRTRPRDTEQPRIPQPTAPSALDPGAPSPFTPPPFTLLHLPPLTHHNEHCIITITPSPPEPHISLVLRPPHPPHTRYTLRPLGGPVTVTNTVTLTSETFPLAELPWKHTAAYRYARRFVDALRKRTLLAYGGVQGVVGRVWADGRGIIEIGEGDNARDIPIAPDGSVEDTTVSPPDAKLARRVYRWLLAHPPPQHPTPPAPEVDSTTSWGDIHVSGTRFVPGVGWCREISDGVWRMWFVDGVRMEVHADGSVVWIDKAPTPEGVGRRKVLKRGMEEEGVRRRVWGFVKAGL